MYRTKAREKRRIRNTAAGYQGKEKEQRVKHWHHHCSHGTQGS
jgi:hypothetical protein